MPKGVCEVTDNNDPEQRWIPIEARSAFEAAINYWGMVAALMAGPGIRGRLPKRPFKSALTGVCTECAACAH